MGDLRLVLRGMWFRRGLTLAVLVLASLVVGGAVTGPLFLRAAGESVLRDTLDQALPVGRSGGCRSCLAHFLQIGVKETSA